MRIEVRFHPKNALQFSDITVVELLIDVVPAIYQSWSGLIESYSRQICFHLIQVYRGN